MNRQELEDLAWQITTPDSKKVSGSVRLLNYGNAWVPISQLPEHALARRAETAQKASEFGGRKLPSSPFVTIDPKDEVKFLPMITRKATIYGRDTSDIGILGMYAGARGIQVSKFAVKVGRYAQYPSAVQVKFISKGYRTSRTMTDSSGGHAGRVDLVILDGWNHPEFGHRSKEISSTPGVSVSRLRKIDEIFSDLNDYIRKAHPPILVDLRGHDATEKL